MAIKFFRVGKPSGDIADYFIISRNHGFGADDILDYWENDNVAERIMGTY